MDGFRTEMNITLVAKKTGNNSASCAGEDETENAILVRGRRGEHVCNIHGESRGYI